MPDVDSLLTWAYGETSYSWAKIASVAPIVLKAAADNDLVASEIVKNAVNEMISGVAAVVAKLYPDGVFVIVVSGGIFDNEFIRNLFKTAFLSIYPYAVIESSKVSAEMGAALVALKN